MAPPPMKRREKQPAKRQGMAPQRILGICLLIAGIAVLAIGVKSQNSSVDAATGSASAQAAVTRTWYIVGGIAISLTGFILAVLGLRTRRAGS